MRHYGKEIGMLMAVVLVVGGTVWFGSSRRTANVDAGTTVSAAAEAIETASPQRHDFSVTCPWHGRVESRETVTLAALAAGRVLSIEAEDGRPVKAGTALFRLGGPELDGRLAAAREAKSAIEQLLTSARDALDKRRQAVAMAVASLREQVGVAQTRLDQAVQARAALIKDLSARLALAKNTVERKQQELRDRITTQDNLDQARRDAMRLETELKTEKQQTSTPEKAALLKLQATLKQAELATSRDAAAAVLRLQAELKAAAFELKRLEDAARITAPVAGVFTQRTVNVGQNVSVGTHLAAIMDPSDLRIVASLFPPPDASVEGQNAVIDHGGGKTTSAIVTKVLPERADTGATLIWIEGATLGRRLRPGETVNGKLVLLVRTSALAVPGDAVVRDEQERPFVFLKTADGYRKQAVRTGLTADEWIEIVEGVPEDGKVVVRGAYELFFRDFSKIYKVVD